MSAPRHRLSQSRAPEWRVPSPAWRWLFQSPVDLIQDSPQQQYRHIQRGKKDNLSEIVQVLVTVLFHHTPQDPSWGFPRSRRLGGGSRRELSGLFRCGKDRAVLRRLRPLCTVRTRTPLQGLIGWESRPHNTQQARRLKRTAENALSLKKLAASDDGQGSCKTLERACTNGRGI